MPASISRIGSDELHDGQAQIDLSESLARVPGIAVRNRQNYAQDLQIQSRGFGARASFGVRGLQLRIDGMPATAPDGQGASSGFLVGALERVEVLRGPLAYAYGNSAGGVIAAFTRPPPEHTTLRGEYQRGANDSWRAAAGAGGMLWADRLGYRLDAAKFSTGGARPHSAAERTQGSAVLALHAGASNRVSLLANTVSQPDAQDPLGLTRAQFDRDPHSTDPVAERFNTRKSLDERQGGLRWEYTGQQSRFELLGYGSRREVEQFLSIPPAVQAAKTHSGGVVELARDFYGAEARYTWSAESLSLSAGLQAQEAREARKGFENFIGPTLGVRGALRRDESNRLRNLDPFVLAQWQPAAEWNVLGALRHSQVSFESDDHFIRLPENPDDSGTRRYSATTPAVGVAYAPLPDRSFYASVGEGFETPTFNEISYRPDGQAGLNFALREATSNTVELGYKQALARGRLLTLALFDTRTRDEIVPATNSGGRASFQNAGHTRRIGAELGVDAALAADWTARLAADWINAEFRSPFTSIAGGTATTVQPGNRLPGVAAHNLFAELAWRRGRPGWSGAAELRGSGDIAVNDTNTDSAPAYAVFNLGALYRLPLSWGEASAFARVDNLADRDYAGSVIVNDGNGRFFEPAAGRAWTAGIEISFVD
ncbi:MAG TPA: TonB-dependent receptor [Candidatus Binatia bacterium]|nr:TonB-dependent receptor [Candidatus Binatia bacterium]